MQWLVLGPLSKWAVFPCTAWLKPFTSSGTRLSLVVRNLILSSTVLSNLVSALWSSVASPGHCTPGTGLCTGSVPVLQVPALSVSPKKSRNSPLSFPHRGFVFLVCTLIHFLFTSSSPSVLCICKPSLFKPSGLIAIVDNNGWRGRAGRGARSESQWSSSQQSTCLSISFLGRFVFGMKGLVTGSL